MSDNWALSNALKFWTLYDLTESEVKLLLLTFSDNELKLTKICRKGESSWDSVLNSQSSQSFLNPSNRLKYNNQAGYPGHVATGDASVDTDILKTEKIQHAREHNRYESQIFCKILGSHNKSFSARTVDLSEGGFQFDEVIPDWVAGYFLVAVDERFELMCSVVEDQKERKRVQVAAEESDPQYVAYKKWLLSL